ncbi:hypothetical protein SAMN04488093_108120 [Tropicibacter naphthalenivorans]|uniref:Uncharacterized protein n=1 Tax=Tropicibacter naphthalenivorans TaxID=441103 RepID=A0A0P1GXI5_9RHOB|nr:hypothetical protein [Tropicibacter naphthalenivorans]CUH81311.1 hypothetical protein TRN7648_03416 [Tropicibacter naphthalenivorans]SMC98316.1 hypothetical protein SAMN04488093_108120 [Tropicibacter naphthalenivorans]
MRRVIDAHDVTRKGLRRVGLFDKGQRADHRVKVLTVAIRAPARFGDDGARLQLGQQIDDLGAGIGPVQRRVAGDPLARAGKKGDDRLGAVRHPDGNAIPGGDPRLVQTVGHGVDARLQALPVQDHTPVAQGFVGGAGLGLLGHEAVKGVARPKPLVIEPLGRGRIVQGQKRFHKRLTGRICWGRAGAVR